LGTPSSANLASAVTDETGSGALVFANSPTLVTPALGTPSALVGTNITGTASGLTAGNVTTNANLTGAVTSVGNATSLGSFSSANLLGALTDETGTGSAVFATSPTLVTPILGTPTSATLTNATGLPIATGVSGLGTGVATFLATPSSANLAAALTDETGTGSAVFATSPTLVTPVLGVATGTSFQGIIGNVTPAAGAFTSVTASTTLGVTGVSTLTGGAVVQGLTVGLGAGAVASNTAVGASALAANTTGADNTALGLNALASNNSGINNTASGRFALTSNTTGVGNTASGYSSLATNIAGSYNTASGGLSLYANTGSNNTAIGYDALNNNTASNNTAVGYQAGYSNTTGADNVFIGDRVAYSNLSGASNTFVGKYAGYDHTSGNRNLIIGPRNNAGNGAGQFLYTGSDNVYVGGYDGYFGGALDLRNETGYLALSDGYGRPLIITKTGQTVALENGVTNATGTGITFPATQSASSNANTLDDYEEGTWTPTQGGNLTIVGTFSSSGTYTKIGRFVVARGVVIGSTSAAFTGGSPAILCAGLPFTSAGAALGNAVDNNFNQGIVCTPSGTSVYGSSAITATAQIVFSVSYFV
jgi:hypothetical protein